VLPLVLPLVLRCAAWPPPTCSWPWRPLPCWGICPVRSSPRLAASGGSGEGSVGS